MSEKWNDVDIEKAIKLIESGENYEKIGGTLNRSKDSVRNKLTKLGLNYNKLNPHPNIECGINEKFCCVCKNKKQYNEFNKNKNVIDGYNNICRKCSNIRSKRYYSENKDNHKKNIYERNKKKIKDNRKKYYNILLNSRCVDCGNDNPIVLEFDHKDDVDKKHGVGRMVGGGYSWDSILLEMGKCDIRCANCHRIRTSKQFNWYKDMI